MALKIGRRTFVAALGGVTFVWPLAAIAQQPTGRTRRIGFLQASLDDPVVGRGYPAFLDELKKSGFSESQNLTIEAVRIDQDAQKVFAETADLVRSNVELLVATGPETALQAAMAASPTIPIVMWAINYDPIARGYVKKPGAVWRQHHRSCLSANGIGGKASRALDPGLTRKNPIGNSLGWGRLQQFWRCGASGEISALGRPITETGKPTLRF